VDICLEHWEYRFRKELYKKPTVDDVKEETVRWYVKIPEFCGYDGEGGCYSYCDKGERGSFPVWVIMFENLTIH
jgi:hypothetical protein